MKALFAQRALCSSIPILPGRSVSRPSWPWRSRWAAAELRDNAARLAAERTQIAERESIAKARAEAAAILTAPSERSKAAARAEAADKAPATSKASAWSYRERRALGEGKPGASCFVEYITSRYTSDEYIAQPKLGGTNKAGLAAGYACS